MIDGADDAVSWSAVGGVLRLLQGLRGLGGARVSKSTISTSTESPRVGVDAGGRVRPGR